MPIIKFQREIRRSGGSFALTLPPELLESLGWNLGDKVQVYSDNEHIVIEKPKKKA